MHPGRGAGTTRDLPAPLPGCVRISCRFRGLRSFLALPPANFRQPSGLVPKIPLAMDENDYGGAGVNKRRLLLKVMADAHNVRFAELCRLAEAFGYRLDRVNGSHHIYEHPSADRPLNLQNVGGKAKAY